MIAYPEIDPVIFSLGPLNVHWYGVTYLIGFSIAYGIGRYRSSKATAPVKAEYIEDLIFYIAVGLIVGSRIGYVLFYNFGKFLDDPLWLFAVWEGGMSFHGGVIGGFFGCCLYARKINIPWPTLLDFIVPMIPIGIGVVRIGNFIGQELWGRETDVAWGMIFPNDPAQLVRHPSQLYEAFLEGLCLFLIVFFYSSKPRPELSIVGVGLLFYGSFRFCVEFFRQPDAHIGIDAFGWMSRGQILSTPMILLGLGLIIWSYAKQKGQVAK